MSNYNHNQAYPQQQASEPQGGAYTAPPPPAGYPMKDGQQVQGQFAPVETKSKGDGFLKGCCAALCCCCVLDACF